ncbi:hypothetical protein CFC21_060081 [Triticum aestivum]|uniref:MPBQ/MBSQ family SAM-binding methyltransferase profile domain-containing protein n=2 Tax=Triticum aestivum TaxID=4565 RepID=A0A3B6JDB9_WHEAT|nr:hypothetical protein CFC21_060081 [Triticum aestivum]
MRDISLEHARLHSRALKVVDVGGGTGFTTLGVVRYVDPENVTLLDQSPHQLDKARKKKALRGIKIMEGDAEDLPFPTDTFDRYVSAGSIEYWPDPQRGIREAYRVLSADGVACMIGPVRPTFWLSRFFADMWMLFPTEEESRHKAETPPCRSKAHVAVVRPQCAGTTYQILDELFFFCFQADGRTKFSTTLEREKCVTYEKNM